MRPGFAGDLSQESARGRPRCRTAEDPPEVTRVHLCGAAAQREGRAHRIILFVVGRAIEDAETVQELRQVGLAREFQLQFERLVLNRDPGLVRDAAVAAPRRNRDSAGRGGGIVARAFLVRLPAAVRVQTLTATASGDAAAWCDAGVLHRGEAQTIALARQISANFLLTDDAAARLLAETCGLRARGSLGVVLWLAGQRRISIAAAGVHLDNLARSSLWVSARVLAEARAALEGIANP